MLVLLTGLRARRLPGFGGNAVDRPQGNFVNHFVERVMRVMTHINIGAAAGLASWVLWSGWQVVTEQIAPGYRVAEVKTLMSLAHAGEPAPMHLVARQSGSGALLPCQTTAPALKQSALVVTGADL